MRRETDRETDRQTNRQTDRDREDTADHKSWIIHVLKPWSLAMVALAGWLP